MAVIIVKNQTAGDLALDNLSAVDRKIPASGQITLTLYNSETSIKEDPQLLGYIDAGNVILNIDGVDQSQADSQNWMNIPSNTDELKEGSSNLYYTEARVSANTSVAANSAHASAAAPHSGHATTSHATTHAVGGSDQIKLDDLAPPDDNTDLNASTSKHGLLPKLGGGTTNFLRADGTWAAPVSVFGSEFQYQEADAEFSTSDNSNWQTALTLNTSSLPSGVYYIGWSCADSQSEDMYFRVQLAGVTIFEPKDAKKGSISGFKITGTISGTKAITIQIKADGDPVGITYRRLLIWRIS